MVVFLRNCNSKSAAGREIRMSDVEGGSFNLCVFVFFFFPQLSLSALTQLMKKMPQYRKEISRVRGLQLQLHYKPFCTL